MTACLHSSRRPDGLQLAGEAATAKRAMGRRSHHPYICTGGDVPLQRGGHLTGPHTPGEGLGTEKLGPKKENKSWKQGCVYCIFVSF